MNSLLKDIGGLFKHKKKADGSGDGGNEYRKNLALYRKKILELKGDRDKLFQRIADFEKERSGSKNWDYQYQMNQIEGERKKLGTELANKMSKLQQKGENWREVQDWKKRTLHDTDKYLSYRGQDLGNQLKTFQDIEKNVATRDRLVEINQDAYKRKNFRVHALIVFFLVAMLLIFPIVGFLGGMLSGSTLGIVIMVVLIFYLVYMIWVMNLLSVKKFSKAAVKDFEILAKDIKNGVYVVRQDVSNAIFGKSHQIPCVSCDDDPHHREHHRKRRAEHIIDVLDGGKEGGIVHNENAFWYYDGTSPPEKIIPSDGEGGSNTVWNAGPDYGSRYTGRYTPPPKWKLKPNRCLPNWKELGDSALPKPTLSHKDLGECVSWQYE